MMKALAIYLTLTVIAGVSYWYYEKEKLFEDREIARTFQWLRECSSEKSYYECEYMMAVINRDSPLENPFDRMGMSTVAELLEKELENAKKSK